MIHTRPPEGVPVYPVAYGAPFLGGSMAFYEAYGPTLAELIAAVPDLPAAFWAYGEVRISGHVIPRERWHVVRPRPSSDSGRPVYVTLCLLPRGGGGDGGSTAKSVVGIVAMLALTLATAGIAGGFLAGATGSALTGGLFAATGALSFLGTGIGAKALALGVGLAGSLAVGALTAPPAAAQNNRRKTAERGAASASGNLIEAGGTLPRVIGTYRVFPALITDAYYELDQQDERVTLVGVLAGPHKIHSIRIGDTDIADADDIEYETREGWPDDAPLTLATRQSRVANISGELSMQAVDPDAPTRLRHQDNPDLDRPPWMTMTSGKGPDEISIRLDFPQGLGCSASDNENAFACIPFRVEMRPHGATDWMQLPEVWFSSRRTDPKRGVVKITWASEPAAPTPPTNRGWIYAYRSVPVQTMTPAGIGGMTAHPYFWDPSRSERHLQASNVATSGVRHVHLSSDAATFYLDAALFPRDVRWDVRIRRGMLLSRAGWNPASYSAIMGVFDWFGYYQAGGFLRVQNDDEWFGSAYVIRAQSVWHEPPVAQMGDTIIAIRARNRAIENVSAVVSGYVPDIETGDWITTSNPAHHFRDVLAGGLNADPLPADLVDEQSLLDWRDGCTANGYEVNALVQGEAVADVLTTIASCGYARPVQSEVWGVYEDRDRSAEPPIQIFSPRNSANFRWEKAFPRLPDGFRVTHGDRHSDYQDQQIVVMRPGASGANLENVTYSGIVTETQAVARANFDLAQALARGTYYYLDAPAEAIVCRRGDLVGVTHDVLSHHAGSARIKSKIVSGGMIIGLVLDSAVTIPA